jgi:predicted RNase H-like nuclease (RuvC/YqgF family)
MVENKKKCPQCSAPLPKFSVDVDVDLLKKMLRDEQKKSGSLRASLDLSYIERQKLDIKIGKLQTDLMHFKKRVYQLTNEANKYRQSVLDDIAHDRYIEHFEDATMRLGLIHARRTKVPL